MLKEARESDGLGVKKLEPPQDLSISGALARNNQVASKRKDLYEIIHSIYDYLDARIGIEYDVGTGGLI
jgi:hypothetical protein